MNRILLNVLTWGTVVSAVVGALALAHAVDQRQPGATPDSRQASADPDAGRSRAVQTGAPAGLDPHSWGMVRQDARP
jgi:hypothetical protein